MRNILLSMAAAFLFAMPSISHALKAGDRAPLFSAGSSQGTVSLEDYLGRKHVVLAFYFADFTPV